MKKFRWGIIAPGRIAKKFALGLHAINNAQLYAVASSVKQRATNFAEDVGGAEVIYEGYSSIINDPEVDAIYIANPHRFHFDTVRACLLAGKPVLCEKPLTVTARETQQLIDLADSEKCFLMEALWSRFLPTWQQVKTWIDEGRIGEVKLIHSTFGFAIDQDPEDRWLNLERAGGVLLDMGVYNVAMSQFITGRDPVRILADGYKGPTGVDERTSVILNYGGAVSVFTCSFEVTTENAFTISGTKGSIRVEPMFWSTDKAVLTCEDGEVLEINNPLRATGLEYEAEEVMRCLAAGQIQSDIMPWEATLSNMETMDYILEQIGVHYPFIER